MTLEQAVNEVSKYHAKTIFGLPVSKAHKKRVAQALGILQTVSNLATHGKCDKIPEYVDCGLSVP